MTVSVPSLSEAKAVTPTEVPMVAFSVTVFAFVSVSVMVETLNSSRSVTVMVSGSVTVLPFSSVPVT